MGGFGGPIGSALGATAGTFLLPGVGTALGGTLGGAAGGVGDVAFGPEVQQAALPPPPSPGGPGGSSIPSNAGALGLIQALQIQQRQEELRQQQALAQLLEAMSGVRQVIATTGGPDVVNEAPSTVNVGPQGNTISNPSGFFGAR